MSGADGPRLRDLRPPAAQLNEKPDRIRDAAGVLRPEGGPHRSFLGSATRHVTPTPAVATQIPAAGAERLCAHVTRPRRTGAPSQTPPRGTPCLHSGVREPAGRTRRGRRPWLWPSAPSTPAPASSGSSSPASTTSSGTPARTDRFRHQLVPQRGAPGCRRGRPDAGPYPRRSADVRLAGCSRSATGRHSSTGCSPSMRPETSWPSTGRTTSCTRSAR